MPTAAPDRQGRTSKPASADDGKGRPDVLAEPHGRLIGGRPLDLHVKATASGTEHRLADLPAEFLPGLTNGREFETAVAAEFK